MYHVLLIKSIIISSQIYKDNYSLNYKEKKIINKKNVAQNHATFKIRDREITYNSTPIVHLHTPSIFILECSL